MTGRMTAVCVVLVLLGAVPATAQTDQQERLKGITEAFVLIENLNDDSASCGITETGLTTAASKALLDNGIGVTDRSSIDSEEAAYFRQHGWSVQPGEIGPLPLPHLYVRVNTLLFEANRQCVSNVSASLRVYLTEFRGPKLWYRAQTGSGVLEFASGGTLVASPSSLHGQRIRDDVFEYVEAIAVDIRIANQ